MTFVHDTSFTVDPKSFQILFVVVFAGIVSGVLVAMYDQEWARKLARSAVAASVALLVALAMTFSSLDWHVYLVGMLALCTMTQGVVAGVIFHLTRRNLFVRLVMASLALWGLPVFFLGVLTSVLGTSHQSAMYMEETNNRFLIIHCAFVPLVLLGLSVVCWRALGPFPDDTTTAIEKEEVGVNSSGRGGDGNPYQPPHTN